MVVDDEKIESRTTPFLAMAEERGAREGRSLRWRGRDAINLVEGCEGVGDEDDED